MFSAGASIGLDFDLHARLIGVSDDILTAILFSLASYCLVSLIMVGVTLYHVKLFEKRRASVLKKGLILATAILNIPWGFIFCSALVIHMTYNKETWNKNNCLIR